MKFKHLDETIRALDKSRKGKWAQLIEGTPKTEPSCALCELNPEKGCGSCIISVFTGDDCTGTPFDKWYDAATLYCPDCPRDIATCNMRCPISADNQLAKKHARRESRMLAAIQKGLEVMQRALAKVK